MWEKILSIFFPEECVGCKRMGVALCASCERHIVRKPRALSPWSAALFEYHNVLIKKSIHALKYNGRRGLAVYFGNALYREFLKPVLRGGRIGHQEILLVPIPASQRTERLRGYNHAAAIAKAIASAAHNDGFPIAVDENILTKARENNHQVAMAGRAAREQNVSGAFVTQAEIPRSIKTLILIDDVITTGATTREARRALKTAGAPRVFALAVAH